MTSASAGEPAEIQALTGTQKMETQGRSCAGCGAPFKDADDGVELWGAWFCSGCFVGNAARAGREMSPTEVAALRRMGSELAGFLPPALVEMILLGFRKRSEGLQEAGVRAELSRAVGEVQRLTAFACLRQSLNLLRTWKSAFDEFADGQEREAAEKIRKLSDFEA